MVSAGRFDRRPSVEDILSQISLSRGDLLERVKPYGFIETGSIMSFLENVCHARPDEHAFQYIRNKIDECLRRHDNGSSYFSALRNLLKDLDYLLFQSECFITHRTR